MFGGAICLELLEVTLIVQKLLYFLIKGYYFESFKTLCHYFVVYGHVQKLYVMCKELIVIFSMAF